MPIIGEIGTFASDEPTFLRTLVALGWLPCDGRSLRTTDYPKLHSVIRFQWGSKDPQLTFLLPDMQGIFLRGSTDSADPNITNRDPDKRTTPDPVSDPPRLRAVGTYQEDALQQHEHGLGIQRYGGNINFQENAQTYMGIGRPKPATEATDGNVSGRLLSETRPKNVYVRYFIFAGLLTQQHNDGKISYPDGIIATGADFDAILNAQPPGSAF